MVATASADCSAQVWDLRLSLPVAPPLFHEVDVMEVIFLPDGKSLATASLDATAKLWHLTRDDRPVEELIRLSEALSSGKVDTQGGFLRLHSERLRELWQSLVP
jgi:WD40 repeat protein